MEKSLVIHRSSLISEYSFEALLDPFSLLSQSYDSYNSLFTKAVYNMQSKPLVFQ